jgi:hypothetical protein
MKILIILSLALTLVPRGCQEENEENWEDEPLDEVGYVAEDIKVRKAIAEWHNFLKESDSAIYAAKVKISEAADCLEDPDIHQKFKLRGKIIKAEGQLEQLSEKLLRAQKFNRSDYEYDEDIIIAMKEFEESFRRKQQVLNETLKELRSDEYYKKAAE